VDDFDHVTPRSVVCSSVSSSPTAQPLNLMVRVSSSAAAQCRAGERWRPENNYRPSIWVR
jgi:hypothetical protein